MTPTEEQLLILRKILEISESNCHVIDIKNDVLIPLSHDQETPKDRCASYINHLQYIFRGIKNNLFNMDLNMMDKVKVAICASIGVPDEVKQYFPISTKYDNINRIIEIKWNSIIFTGEHMKTLMNKKQKKAKERKTSQVESQKEASDKKKTVDSVKDLEVKLNVFDNATSSDLVQSPNLSASIQYQKNAEDKTKTMDSIEKCEDKLNVFDNATSSDLVQSPNLSASIQYQKNAEDKTKTMDSIEKCEDKLNVFDNATSSDLVQSPNLSASIQYQKNAEDKTKTMDSIEKCEDKLNVFDNATSSDLVQSPNLSASIQYQKNAEDKTKTMDSIEKCEDKLNVFDNATSSDLVQSPNLSASIQYQKNAEDKTPLEIIDLILKSQNLLQKIKLLRQIRRLFSANCDSKLILKEMQWLDELINQSDPNQTIGFDQVKRFMESIIALVRESISVPYDAISDYSDGINVLTHVQAIVTVSKIDLDPISTQMLLKCLEHSQLNVHVDTKRLAFHLRQFLRRI